MNKKLVITKKIDNILKEKNLTAYKLSKLMQVSDSALYGMIKGDTPFSKKFIEKLLPIIKVKESEFIGWIIADKYPKETIELAVQTQKGKHDDKLILTTRLDEILSSKNISRTSLSKIIDYSQGSLNDVITGKKSISKSVISRLAATLEIKEEQITSWIIADKYSSESLKTALKEQSDKI